MALSESTQWEPDRRRDKYGCRGYSSRQQMESHTGLNALERVRTHPARSRYEITVEPVLFLVFFSTAFTESATVNTLETQICRLVLNLSDDNCTGTFTPSIYHRVQPFADTFVLIKSLLEAFFPAILSFFIGPWSDINGRKPFFIYSITGYCLYHLIWGILSFWRGTPPMLFLTATAALAAPGGFVAMFTCAFCYLGDVTTESNRGLRMGIAESILLLGILCGYLAVPKIHDILPEGYANPVLFIIGAGMCFLGLLYLIFFIPESVDISQRGRSSTLFEANHVKKMFRTILTKRPQHGRTIIMLLIAVCSIAIATMLGEVSVRYYSVQEKFSWSQTDFNDFSALSSFTGAVGSLLGMWLLSEVMKLSDVTVALIATATSLVSQLLTVFSETSEWFVISYNLGCLGGLIGPVIRSELSKIVSKTDLGKVFAFVTSMEAVIPLFGGPLYLLLYRFLLSTSPLYVYLLSVGLSSLRMAILIAVVFMEHSYGKPYYIMLEEESSEIVPPDTTSMS